MYFFRLIIFSCLLLWGVLCSDLYADQVWQSQSGTTQWDLDTTWSDGTAPSSANDYYTSGGLTLTSPSGTPTFGGNTVYVGYKNVDGTITPSGGDSPAVLKFSADTTTATVASMHWGNVSVQNMGECTLQGTDVTNRVITLDGTVTFIGNGDSNVASPTLTVSNKITGTGNVVIDSGGTVLFSHETYNTGSTTNSALGNTYTGTTTIKNGSTLQVYGSTWGSTSSISKAWTSLGNVWNISADSMTTEGSSLVTIESGGALEIVNNGKYASNPCGQYVLWNTLAGEGTIRKSLDLSGSDTAANKKTYQAVYFTGDMSSFHGTVELNGVQAFLGAQKTIVYVYEADYTSFNLSGKTIGSTTYTAELGLEAAGKFSIAQLNGDEYSVVRRAGSSSGTYASNKASLTIGGGEGKNTSVFLGTLGVTSGTKDADYKNRFLLDITGVGNVVTLKGTGYYTLGTAITAATLEINNGNALGTGAVTLSGGTLRSIENNITLANDINILDSDSYFDTQTNLTLSGKVADTQYGTGYGSSYGTSDAYKTGAGTLTLTGSSVEIGNLHTNSGTAGVGDVILAGTNQTYTGSITGNIKVANGASVTFDNPDESSVTNPRFTNMLVKGDINSSDEITTASLSANTATGKTLTIDGNVYSGSSFISSGSGELDIRGALNAGLTIGSGTFSPGIYASSNSADRIGTTQVGTTSGDFTLSSGATLWIDLADFNADDSPNNDLLDVNGAAVFESGAQFILNILSSQLDQSHVFTLVESTGVTGFDYSAWNYALYYNPNSWNASGWEVLQEGNNIIVKYTGNSPYLIIVPEPSAFLLLLLGSAVLICYRRFKSFRIPD